MRATTAPARRSWPALGLKQLRLLTNNPDKRAALEGYGLEVVERIGVQTVPTVHNLRYLQTKRDKVGHDIVLVETQTA